MPSKTLNLRKKKGLPSMKIFNRLCIGIATFGALQIFGGLFYALAVTAFTDRVIGPPTPIFVGMLCAMAAVALAVVGHGFRYCITGKVPRSP